MKKNALLGSWTGLMDSVILYFGPSKYEDYQGTLSKLTQKRTVAKYRLEFEALMNKVTWVTESWLISIWIARLKPVIQREV